MDISLPLLTAKVYSAFLLLVGISCILRPNLWADYVLELKEQKYGMLALSLVALPFALIMVNTHNIWEWTPTVFVSFAAWMMLIKYTVYLLFPKWWPSMLAPTTKEGLQRRLKLTGPVALVIGAILVYFTYIDIPYFY